jgi:hypothetical protein
MQRLSKSTLSNSGGQSKKREERHPFTSRQVDVHALQGWEEKKMKQEIDTKEGDPQLEDICGAAQVQGGTQ